MREIEGFVEKLMSLGLTGDFKIRRIFLTRAESGDFMAFIPKNRLPNISEIPESLEELC